MAEYPLYFAFLEKNYPERVNKVELHNDVEIMNSAICSKEEMECCAKKGVLLKGCHDHRLEIYAKSGDPGTMCCPDLLRKEHRFQ